MSFLGFFLVLSCLPSALIDFALPQWESEPRTRIEDAYKWIYQAMRGGEHAVPDKEAAREYLTNEWRALGDARADEPLWQPLCADESIGRINLRVFRAGNGRADILLDAFVESAAQFADDETNFLAAWRELGARLARKSHGSLKRREWQRLDGEMKKKNYPAIHHSPDYEETRRPAYRVVTRAVACRRNLLDCAE